MFEKGGPNNPMDPLWTPYGRLIDALCTLFPVQITLPLVDSLYGHPTTPLWAPLPPMDALCTPMNPCVPPGLLATPKSRDR